MSRIGWSQLAADAALLKTQSESEVSVLLPESAWPVSIRELEPLAVRLSREGVFVKRWERLVAEEGVFIAFAGVDVDARPGTDPSLTPIAPQVYWYRIKG